MTSKIFLLRWAWRVWKFVTWLYRKIGPPDYISALVFFAVAGLLSLASLLGNIDLIRSYVRLSNESWVSLEIVGNVVCLPTIIFGGVFVFRLRMIGVASVDGSPESGLDYRGALESVSEGFDFLGIGASKLTGQAKSFETAILRMSQHHGKVRILLCDPRTSAIEGLEQKAGVNLGRYKANVKQSFTLLHHLRDRFEDTLEVRLYKLDSDGSLPPFRMMFVNNELCLLSQVVVGAPNEGRLLPQLHIYKKPMFAKMPNFYRAYQTLFDQLWQGAKPANTADFEEIAQINVTLGGGRNA